jgi:hypothetical protein
VFVSESVLLDVPLAVAQHRLLEYLHRGNLETIACDAYADGVTMLAEAGVAGLSKTVQIQSIPAYLRGTITVIPLRWIATGAFSGAFPVLDANLELTATEAGTRLEIVGSYRPPFGAIGAAVDHLLLHTVASSTVRRFVALLGEVAAAAPPAESLDSDVGFASGADGDPVCD